MKHSFCVVCFDVYSIHKLAKHCAKCTYINNLLEHHVYKRTKQSPSRPVLIVQLALRNNGVWILDSLSVLVWFTITINNWGIVSEVTISSPLNITPTVTICDSSTMNGCCYSRSHWRVVCWYLKIPSPLFIIYII